MVPYTAAPTSKPQGVKANLTSTTQQRRKTFMKPSEIDSLGSATCSFVMRGAADYLRVHNLTCDPSALAECCRSWAKIKLPEALADAKEAFECGMTQVGVTTFALSMRQAGVEAAKECSQVKAEAV